ncbi:paired amphipathic helix protein Sin3-like 5 [Oryza brachyantha]|uniref:paired amphipathic helix protein Sin3-like 5 n=1 Tax=Oryza brachyantha TaxID=4533 RepID=UPI00077685CA|nr:paired amphipathic helix protein Sin3-like 5 [Oryza brachyantha]
MVLNMSVIRVTCMPPSARAQRVTKIDAERFIHTIKIKFADHPEKFNQFYNILKGFCQGRIGIYTVADHVRILFDGYPELLLAFNKFLPNRCKIFAHSMV